MSLKKAIVLALAVILMISVCFSLFPEENKEDIVPETAVSESEKAVLEIMKEMTLSDKVYQMMFVTPESITGVGTVIRAGEATKQALTNYPVGGIVYFAHNFENREQTKEMIANTQSYSEIPLFISVDEEGGRVSRLGSNPLMGVTKHPAMKVIGDSGDFEKAYNIGVTLASDLKELGFNVDFAPDADVLIDGRNSEIGDRSFGTEPEVVSKMVKNVVRGMEENGVSATLKHFPGHGSTLVDSHTGYSSSERTVEELRNCEFLPFKEGIASGVDFIMISHMTLTNATEEKLPSSMSKEVITDMLKTELGYEGIVITDSFSMGAVTEEYENGEAAVISVKAGVDMILMPKDLENVHGAIVKAVESGEITEDRIDESVKKILMLKYNKNMLNN